MGASKGKDGNSGHHDGKDDACMGDGANEKAAAATAKKSRRRRRRKRGAASAPPLGTAGDDPGDAWADDAPPRRASTVRPTRSLKVQSSRSRSPRRLGEGPKPLALPTQLSPPGDTTADPAACQVTVSCKVILQGLSSRQELNGVTAVVSAPCNDRGRWPVKLDCGEEVTVLPGNLRTSFFG